MSASTNAGVTIWRCATCHAVFFPERLLCSRCHGSAFTQDRVHEGVIEEISTLRHMLGQENWQPRRIASVLTSKGPRMTVGLRDESGAGARVELFEENGAPLARAKSIT